jgi:hypothetical protein
MSAIICLSLDGQNVQIIRMHLRAKAIIHIIIIFFRIIIVINTSLRFEEDI